MNRIITYIRQEEWSPYVAGIGLGVVAILSLLLTGNPVGASGSFENVVGMIGKAVAPGVFDNLYFDFVMPPGIAWQVVLVFGMVIGGALGAISSGTWKLTRAPEGQWKAVFGQDWRLRWVLAFVGAIILEVGAGIAGGCTSGLAIAGGLELAPAAFLFMGGMFATGIAMALILYRRRY